MGISHDFLTWKSFPSSAKVENPTSGWMWLPTIILPAIAGSMIKISVSVKQRNVSGTPSRIDAVGIKDGQPIGIFIALVPPMGSFDWEVFEGYGIVPAEREYIGIRLAGGALGETWFDDLKIYQDDILIYSNDFSNWNPFIGAGVGAPIGGVAGYLLKEPLGPMVSEAVGAVLGGALGGGVGLLTGLGIIPVPQIPALEAAPEGPGAPARLGKYQITG